MLSTNNFQNNLIFNSARITSNKRHDCFIINLVWFLIYFGTICQNKWVQAYTKTPLRSEYKTRVNRKTLTLIDFSINYNNIRILIPTVVNVIWLIIKGSLEWACRGNRDIWILSKVVVLILYSVHGVLKQLIIIIFQHLQS